MRTRFWIADALPSNDPLTSVYQRPLYLKLIVDHYVRENRIPASIGPLHKDAFKDRFRDPEPGRVGCLDLSLNLLAALAFELTVNRGTSVTVKSEALAVFGAEMRRLGDEHLLDSGFTAPECLRVCIYHDVLAEEADYIRFEPEHGRTISSPKLSRDELTYALASLSMSGKRKGTRTRLAPPHMCRPEPGYLVTLRQ